MRFRPYFYYWLLFRKKVIFLMSVPSVVKQSKGKRKFLTKNHAKSRMEIREGNRK